MKCVQYKSIFLKGVYAAHGREGSLLGVSESAFAEFSFSTPSAPPSTYTFKLIGRLADGWSGALRLENSKGGTRALCGEDLIHCDNAA
jgi:hypothetical protein